MSTLTLESISTLYAKYADDLRAVRDAQRKFANVASRQRGVLVYDRFVIR